METIEINSLNYKEYQDLNVIGFSLAHAGAQGEGGGIKIVTSDGKLYHTNICHSIKLEEAFDVCPPLRVCHFKVFNSKVPKGWSLIYMGGGNFLVIKEQFRDKLLSLSQNDLYWNWEKVLNKINLE